VAFYGLISVLDYFRLLFTNDKYSSLRNRPEIILSQLLVLTVVVLFVFLYKGLKNRKKWSYWASLIVTILTLFSLPFGGLDITGVVLLLAGILIVTNKKQYTR
jgi:lysylphosphatidylglycerol synthetase-like protein (DUF2156 family)